MTIEFEDVSKRYTERWIIKNCSLSLQANQVYGVVGPNGSGKSTLLKLISGFLSPSKGRITYRMENRNIERDLIYQFVSLAAPYASYQKQMTLREMTRFIMRFKKLRKDSGVVDILKTCQLDVPESTELRSLSSGQFQKFCLTAAILSDTEILLLDEPGSYLDEDSKEWFQTLLKKHLSGRVVIIASNDKGDLDQCTQSIDIRKFK